MKSQNALEPEKQISQLSAFVENISISNLNDMLERVVKEVPHLVNSRGASLYLLPELVPQYDGSLLLDENFQTVPVHPTRRDFIVLAATSRAKAQKLLGKAFYLPDEMSLTGWVFKHGKPLRIADSSNQAELHAIDPKLHWNDRYKESDDYYDGTSPKPILLVPLLGRRQTIGVLKILATCDKTPFTATAEAIALIIAQIIAKILGQTLLLQEQNRKIIHLMELGTKEKPQEVFEAVTQSLQERLECSMCQLYLSFNADGTVRLVAENGGISDMHSIEIHARGQGMIGWVFKTGKPLLIDDLREYSTGRVLDNALLTCISDGPNIEDEDRYLQSESFLTNEDKAAPFLAVPVKSRAGSIWGVLCAYCLNDQNNRRDSTFTRSDLQLMRSFASTISLAIQNDRQRELGLLLIRMGQTWEPSHLYELIVDDIPKLLPGAGCSIFRLTRSSFGAKLKLVKSNREGLTDKDARLSHITYKIGAGKTGFCAFAQAILVINHYGAGKVAQQQRKREFQRITSRYPDDLVTSLLDQEGRNVGVIQLWHGLKTSPQVQRTFQKLCQHFKIQPNVGLTSPKQNLYTQSSWSFVAVPIKTKNNELYGVITAGRPVEQNPFLPNEVSLLESIAGRLAVILHNIEMEEQRQQLLMSVAHEINTPLQGILADTENLVYELQNNSELDKLSRHNLDQVLRLHLQTETIMAVLTKHTPAREFSVHSLYRPLKAACKMFASEAAAKGCNILEPQPIHSHFPKIEMSVFDLELAFKNLIHNAVKYSFQASHSQNDASRYVRILGRWADENQSFYRIFIQNYGIGISVEEIEQRLIFQPYYRGKSASDRRRTGSGLGLAHARQIIENLHHGRITATSKHLSGTAYLTTFVVTLPVTQPKSHE
jgi:signal transduction histidine kinase